ncbi:MAG: hypothetical protein KatS3mg105_0729 [Gemmatales bacterium]|nr:MAG: hypothetical protein KatS3mg105_0729 [Gemmatales bacterium]
MRTINNFGNWIGAALCLIVGSFGGVHAGEYDPVKEAGLSGGLLVQLGAGDTTSAARLSHSGRFLIHVLDGNSAKVEAARRNLTDNGFYGLAWAEVHQDRQQLPYAENVVNLIVVAEYAVPASELFRVLTPYGRVLFLAKGLADKEELQRAGFTRLSESGSRVLAQKPWPKEMDEWSHPRHGSNGNAVSLDTLVGPPERVRWIAAATSEVEGMVTAGGRNFYGGMIARDGFNGLRLWHRDLRKSDSLNAFDFRLPRLSSRFGRPVATAEFVFAVRQNQPVALNARTGEVELTFGDVRDATELLFDGERVIVAEGSSVRAFRIEPLAIKDKSGRNSWQAKQIWKYDCSNPSNVIADGKWVALIKGEVRRGEKREAVVLDARTGEVEWQRSDYPWLPRTARTVLADDMLIFEESSLNDHDAGNGIHVVEAKDGEHRWSKSFPPGMNHRRQARAMVINKNLWILHGGKVNTAAKEKMKREPVQVSALDPKTGRVRVTLPAGLAHCFPPVCTPNYLFAGELDLTSLLSGKVIANRITKANCSPENGWVPANGLVYTTPKHCTCWPMLRGYVAMAPASTRPNPATLPVEKIDFVLEKGPAQADPKAASPTERDWPLYRHDVWRSSSTPLAGPENLREIWRVPLNTAKEALVYRREASANAPAIGPILHDWRNNPKVKGPLSAPTIAYGKAFVMRPNAHELVAVDTSTGEVRWRFRANGRLDTPPAIYRGLCLFGSADGWVYAVRADTGDLVWRLRAAPTDERIVAHGQVESPWPVPGAVLVMDDVAYFAAGRQPLADGGILLFAVDPLTGKRHWVRRIDSVPQKGFYENSGLEFDPFDILHKEGKGIAMSRWIVSLDGRNVSVDKWNAFARLDMGAGGVWVPRGSWTYDARHQHRFAGEASRRPLVAFRDDNVYSYLNGTTTLFRRDFDLDKGEKFNSKWITGWEAGKVARQNGRPYRTDRIAQNAKWKVDPFADPKTPKKPVKYGTQLYNRIHGMALAKDRLYVVHQDGRLKVISTADGKVVTETRVPPPAWDGLAIAEGKLFLTTQAGELVCLGEK